MDTNSLIVFANQYASPLVGIITVALMCWLTTAFLISTVWKRILPFGIAIGLCYLNNLLVGYGMTFLVKIGMPIIAGVATGWLAQIGYKFVLKSNSPNP